MTAMPRMLPIILRCWRWRSAGPKRPTTACLPARCCKRSGYSPRHEHSSQLTLIRSQTDLSTLLSKRAKGQRIVGALLGTEGSHALDGELENIDRLYAAGFRMMGLQHFFDNRLGGSLHGESQTGLTRFGIDAVKKMHAMDVMIDVAHSSEATVRDTLAATGNAALIVSHTGFQGHCPSPRNISDETMALITQAGGLIGVGFWPDVTCGEGVGAIAEAIRYGVNASARRTSL